MLSYYLLPIDVLYLYQFVQINLHYDFTLSNFRGNRVAIAELNICAKSSKFCISWCECSYLHFGEESEQLTELNWSTEFQMEIEH